MLLPDYVTRESHLFPVGPHEAEGFFHRSHSRAHTRRFRYSQTLFLFSTLSFRLSLFSCIYHFIPFLIVYHTFSSLYVFHLSPMLPIFKDIKYPPFLSLRSQPYQSLSVNGMETTSELIKNSTKILRN